MNDPIEFLDLDDLVSLAVRLLGDQPPVRDIGLLGAAVARPSRPRPTTTCSTS